MIAIVPSRNEPTSSAAIIGDKSCIYCGHDLRGVNAHDVCPECGKPAGYSLLGDHLRDVDSGWIRLVMHGISVVALGFVVLCLVRTLQLLPALGVHEADFDTNLLRFCVSAIGWITFTVGVFMITQPETSGSLIARRRGVPETVRWSTVIAAAIAFVPDAWFAHRGQAFLIGSEAFFSVAVLLSQSLLWLHLRKIIDRTPRREVARVLKAMFLITLVLFIFVSRIVLYAVTLGVSTERALFTIHTTAVCLIVLHHLAAIYPLIVTRKAIRRTVGYWDI